MIEAHTGNLTRSAAAPGHITLSRLPMKLAKTNSKHLINMNIVI